ncbi:Catalytic LigB subunit of aromatic ring-opening dioxygenase [Paenibacillus algorifonticola]|uniref:Catalytic LigB subunit of aromatic ring-opening dioxygenase n=1 Tax=Paenibacillus algorifonticola TaxID=684063 RepID=A0A1I1YN64_9BACL|nr:Catalytic LigB subunit of aromatic ring-opening dioxygenase [Paenibacillus algorifonticola]
MLPSLFICHGSPLSAMVESDYTRFLSNIGKKYQPNAIVLFSAHWEQRNTTIAFTILTSLSPEFSRLLGGG